MNDASLADLQAAIVESAVAEYLILQIKMHLVPSGHECSRWEGQAAGIREATNRLAETAGLATPDWDAIREAVSADGISHPITTTTIEANRVGARRPRAVDQEKRSA